MDWAGERMFTMNSDVVTSRQAQILAFLESCQAEDAPTPSYREIGARLGIGNVSAVAKHVASLRRKGFLATTQGKARSIRVRSPMRALRNPVVDIPLLGSIPAGSPRDRMQDVEGCVSLDIESVGIRTTSRTFALRVAGDSMMGKHILSGDIVVIEHGKEPRTGDVVAALVDGQSTLKTFLLQKGRPFLRAENPAYPDLIPATELVIQGVMVALVRKVV